jgi:hypothetical protein
MAGPRLSAEATYLFRLAGPNGDDPPPSGLSWAEVIRLADEEKAIPTLFGHLKARGMAELGRAERLRLQQLMVSWAARMSYLECSLERLLSRYASAGIRVVLLKGAALAASTYRSFPRRPMADLDLLVDEARAQEAWELARSTEWSMAPGQRPADVYRDHQHLAPLDDRRGTGLGLELHTDLFPRSSPFAFGAEQLWSSAERARVGECETLVPCDLHMVLHLCTHFAWSHGLADAAWRTFRDLQTLIDAGRVDWAALVRLSRASRSSTCCYWTLRLAQNLSRIEVPDETLSALAPPASEGVMRSLERYYSTVLCRPADWQHRTTFVASTLWRLGIRPGWSGHGSARPWQHDDTFASLRRHSRENEATGLVARTGRAPYRWRQFFRELRALAP